LFSVIDEINLGPAAGASNDGLFRHFVPSASLFLKRADCQAMAIGQQKKLIENKIMPVASVETRG